LKIRTFEFSTAFFKATQIKRDEPDSQSLTKFNNFRVIMNLQINICLLAQRGHLVTRNITDSSFNFENELNKQAFGCKVMNDCNKALYVLT